MKKTSLLIFLAATLLLAACSGNIPSQEEATKPATADTPVGNTPNLPEPSTDRGPVYEDSLEVLPGKTADELIIHLSGNLPSACSQLTFTANLAEGSNKIEVVAFSSEPADKMCAQMLTPFDEQVSVPGLTEGRYDITFNGELNRSVTVPLITDVPAK